MKQFAYMLMIAVFALAGPLGCGNSSDDDSSGTDTGMDDTGMDDTGMDDTGMDDTGSDTTEDTTEDTGTDTVEDTGDDTATDVVEDTAMDVVEDTAMDTAMDTGDDTAMDTGDDTAMDTAMDTGADRLEANGCTYETATNLTGMATINIGDTSAWDFGHQACVIVDAGTAVTWAGNLTLHPVVGGESGSPDAGSPIDSTGQDAEYSATLDTAGDFPYYCGNHPNMQGVIYVD